MEQIFLLQSLLLHGTIHILRKHILGFLYPPPPLRKHVFSTAFSNPPPPYKC